MAGWLVMYPGFPKRAGALAETRAAGATAPAAGGEPRGTATGRRNGRKGASGASGAAAAALTLGALGIVFGDIGTSPLYAMSSIFAVHGVRPAAHPQNDPTEGSLMSIGKKFAHQAEAAKGSVKQGRRPAHRQPPHARRGAAVTGSRAT